MHIRQLADWGSRVYLSPRLGLCHAAHLRSLAKGLKIWLKMQRENSTERSAFKRGEIIWLKLDVVQSYCGGCTCCGERPSKLEGRLVRRNTGNIENDFERKADSSKKTTDIESELANKLRE